MPSYYIDENGIEWKNTSVRIRRDIAEAAKAKMINVSRITNEALKEELKKMAVGGNGTAATVPG